MQPVKAALLGVQHPHSLPHLRTLQALSEVAAIFLWDESQTALDQVVAAQGTKVESTYTNLNALLARDDLFFVIAALRNDLGPEIFLRTLRAGKHLLAEKPIGRRAADTQYVIEAAHQAGRHLGVCYQNRTAPAIRMARDLVQQGLLGSLMSVEMRLVTTQVQFRDPQHWLFHQAQAGGGILAWLGCHYIDMLRYITGDEIVAVSAEMATRSGENIDVEDVAALSVRLQSGAIGSLHIGYMLAQSGRGYQNSSGYDTYVGINGQLGRIYWSTNTIPPTQIVVESVHPAWAAAPQRTFAYTPGISLAYGGAHGEQFVRDFIGAAQGNGTMWASGDDALQVARVVDAAYESSRLGRRIYVEHE